jgi:hypothetical protein
MRKREVLSRTGLGEDGAWRRIWGGHGAGSLPQPLTSVCSVPQRLADAAENFQKAHRWQDNIKVRVTAYVGSARWLSG